MVYSPKNDHNYKISNFNKITVQDIEDGPTDIK